MALRTRSPLTNSSNVVRIQFTFKDQANKEVVHKVTKGHEVVEVDGFVFKRKRKSEVLDASKHAKAGDNKDNGGEEEVVVDQALLAMARDFLAEALPDSCPTATKLLFLVQEMMRAEARAQEGSAPGISEAVQQLCSAFDSSLQTEMARASARVPSAAAAAAAAATTQDGAAEAAASTGEMASLPPCLRELCQQDVLRASLSHQLQRLQDEEAFWHDMQARYGGGGASEGAEVEAAQQAPAGPAPAHADGATATAAAAAAAECALPVSAQAAVSELPSVADQLHGRLAVQVESLASLVTKAEELTGRAEAACSALQAEYHADKFRTFAHVNSPAWLVKTMSTAQPYPAGGAALADASQQQQQGDAATPSLAAQ